ncbi:hypothetical protein TPY_2035 [Sulfobacillus acidophilus TPY]|uniref:Uncharacterized protein n=1 Tax=Sulfobacillus acidophilus (strain ATCC 700253 / DSM 10332 / NAL) TaxID=679936 RepID=G8TTN0_SULAD|nr:hypothetical protein TPY_2035 [Sulfobacillus acidophilus TPY]AEW05696.1 hypothetical protein Sulac_2221 [Sulfobacillus acidophilus DSM 10332]
MIHRYRALLGTGMAVGAVIFGGTALAATQSPSFTVTGLSIQSVSSSGGFTTVDVAITVLDTGNQGGSWEFPDTQLVGGNPNAMPSIDITDTTTGNPVATDLSSYQLVTNPDPFVSGGQSATAVYAFQLPTPASPGDSFSIQLVNQPAASTTVFHMYQLDDEKLDTAPVTASPPPSIVGQLPEVPWAVGVPLVGLGVVGFWGLRRRGSFVKEAVR